MEQELRKILLQHGNFDNLLDSEVKAKPCVDAILTIVKKRVFEVIDDVICMEEDQDTPYVIKQKLEELLS